MAHQNLTDKEIEILEGLATNSIDVLKKLNPTHVEKFIQENKITEGKTFYPSFIIYYLYHKKKRSNKMSKRSFFVRFSKYFNPSKKYNVYGYYLSEGCLPINKDIHFSARAYNRRLQNVKKKEKNKKK